MCSLSEGEESLCSLSGGEKGLCSSSWVQEGLCSLPGAEEGWHSSSGCKENLYSWSGGQDGLCNSSGERKDLSWGLWSTSQCPWGEVTRRVKLFRCGGQTFLSETDLASIFTFSVLKWRTCSSLRSCRCPTYVGTYTLHRVM